MARGGDEVEPLEVGDAQLGHPQHHLRQIRAVDFLRGVHLPLVEVLDRVEPVAGSRLGSSRPSPALVAGGLGHGSLHQAGGVGAGVVVVELCQAGVDDGGDAGDGDAGLGDVGGDDHLLPAEGRRVEYPLLLLLCQPAVEGHQVELAAEGGVAEPSHAVLDNLLARQEAQDVPRLPVVQHPADGVLNLGKEGLGGDGGVGAGGHLRRVVDQGDRIGDGVYGDDGAAVEVAGEYFGVHGGRRHDDLEFLAGGQHPLQEPQHEVDVQAALVGLVHHHHGVAGQPGVQLHLLQQDAVGHNLDAGGGVSLVLEPHLVAHQAGVAGLELPGDELADAEGGDAAGLGDGNHAGAGVAGLVEDDGELGGLSRTGGALHHHHLACGQGLKDAFLLLVDGQVSVVVLHLGSFRHETWHSVLFWRIPPTV